MAPGQIRIIAGALRGRKLQVPDLPQLRPTPDRVRETVFNWLAPIIQGANCLDAYAGSGALGFEALSRGALHVTFTDSSPAVIQLIRKELAIFGITAADVYLANMPQQLKKPKQPFDVVFLDPPFQDEILPICFFLAEHDFLAPGAYIYLESAHTLSQNVLPASWELLKSKKTGNVAYHLVRKSV